MIEYLLELEEIQVMLRSCLTCLKRGDRDIDLFQAFASARRKKNFATRLKDDGGNRLEGMAGLNPHIQNYFTHCLRLKGRK